jgi:hypothetical protein
MRIKQSTFNLTNASASAIVASGMKPLSQMGLRLRAQWLGVLLSVLALMTMARVSVASPPINTSCPAGFFTNVASRLLSSQLNVNLARIQIYPTNQYTPAVHRLLQVTANIFDATTTNFYPSVFRPLFWKTNELIGGDIYQTNIYIIGYQYVQEPLTTNGLPIFTLPTDVADLTIPFGMSGMSNNIYGIPWVIGVKKGLPNFNALEIANCFFIERLLQFNRNTTSPGRTYTTNQMYVIGISNIFGVEDWNSYASNYNNAVTIVAQDTFTFGLSNDAPGFVTVTNSYFNVGAPSLITWPGVSSSSSFVLPFGTNVIGQSLSPYGYPPSTNNLYVYFYGSGIRSTNINGLTYNGPCFIPLSANPINYMDSGTPPLPHFVLQVTNRLQAYILDTHDPNNVYVLDYVQLGGMNGSLDVNTAIADISISPPFGLWSTNFFSGNTPYGVNEQYLVSLGVQTIPAEDNDGGFWSTTVVPGAQGNTSPAAQAAFFQAFFSPNNIAAYAGAPSGILTNFQLSIQAPFTPTRLVIQRMVYEANDPLVHYMTSDLNDFPDDTNGVVSSLSSPPGLKYTGRINDRYMPWGTAGNLAKVGYSYVPRDNNAYNLSYKDPLVKNSDSWNFPTNQALNASWLGQLHRGTPWQTIFLKSTNILDLVLSIPNGPYFNSGLPTWQIWTGDTNATDATSMAPVQDWRMASLLASLFNTNSPGSLFSVNEVNPNDWEGFLNDMTVLTNDLSDIIIGSPVITPQFASLIISSNSSQAGIIASAIESVRSTSPGQLFANKGDIFSVPQLSTTSPYLNLDSVQIQKGISDAAYEAIPSQLLPLLRTDSIGSVSNNGQIVIQFTGDDGHVYAVQSSCNLVNWTSVSTNCPFGGIFTFTNTITADPRFYRTVLLQ